MEDEATNREWLEHKGVDVPFAFGLDAEGTSRALGCYYDAEKRHLQATGFLVDPEGKVFLGSYSTGPVGRIRAENAYAMIRYVQTDDAGFLPEA